MFHGNDANDYLCMSTKLLQNRIVCKVYVYVLLHDHLTQWYQYKS
jgi:hypothetical protein